MVVAFVADEALLVVECLVDVGDFTVLEVLLPEEGLLAGDEALEMLGLLELLAMLEELVLLDDEDEAEELEVSDDFGTQLNP